ncbi:MAG: ribosome biogenesis GTP-binding protein YihA/YsxC [Vicinamibacterales bacterium]
MKIAAEFVTSVVDATAIPTDRQLPEVALVGRSNVGKSSLINAMVRRRLARTSAAPGKTRLINLYRVTVGNGAPRLLVDLPGYGYARGGTAAAGEFQALTQSYFGRAAAHGQVGALLLVDARHPGLENDRAAWQWLQTVVQHPRVVATKIDKLPRGQRIRALRELESVFEDAVLPVSSVTGEGLDELWKLIDRLPNSPKPHRPSPPRATPPRK